MPTRRLGVTYDEVVEAIGRGQKGDWLAQGGGWVYKHDLHLRIEQTEKGVAGTGDPFSEEWVDELPTTEPAERVVFWVYYGVNRIMEIHTVLVDRRTSVPLPDERDRFSGSKWVSMSRWDYNFGKIVELYSDTELGGINSLDTILARAGISVRE